MGGSGHRRYESRDVQSIGICGLLPPGFYALYGVILAAPLFDLSFNYTMYDTSHLSAIRAFLLSIVMIHDFVDDPALTPIPTRYNGYFSPGNKMLWIRKQFLNAAYIMGWVIEDRHQNVLGKITKCREARRGILRHSPLLSSRARIVG